MLEINHQYFYINLPFYNQVDIPLRLMDFHFKFRVALRPTTDLRGYFDVQLVMSVEMHGNISVGGAFS
jgi:hypothetical protein